jgi:uncharacterized protein YrzB (UPF0473 family)
MDNEKDPIIEEETETVADLVTLTDEDGVEHSFELVDTIEKNDVMYAALIAGVDDPALLEGDGNLVIMKAVTDETGEEYLELIEDDDEFEMISEIFMERLADLYEFEEVEDLDLDALDI